MLYVKGLNPGPLVFINNAHEVTTIFRVFILANLLIIPLGVLAIAAASPVLRIPMTVLAPLILGFCIVGSFSIDASASGIEIMIVVGFFPRIGKLRKLRMNQAMILKGHLAAGDLVAAPGAPVSLSARLVERADFPAVYMTGFGATATRLGMPDIGLLTQTEMAEHARNMVRAVSIPVIADADTGYGGPSNIHRTVQEYLQAGVAALHLEDQIAPKRCGQMAGIRLMERQEAALRLEAALAARGASDMLIIGRTDALLAMGLEEAARRSPSTSSPRTGFPPAADGARADPRRRRARSGGGAPLPHELS